MYGRDPLLPIYTLLHPRLKYLGTQLHRQNLEKMHIAMREAAKRFRKVRQKQREY